MNNKVKGYLFAAISAATYGMNPLFALPPLRRRHGFILCSFLPVTFVIAGGNIGKALLRLRKMFPKLKAKDNNK